MANKYWIVCGVICFSAALGFMLKPHAVRGFQRGPSPSYTLRIAHRAACDRNPAAPPSQTQLLARKEDRRVEAWMDNATNEVTSRHLHIGRGASGDVVLISDLDRAKTTLLSVAGGADYSPLNPGTCIDAGDGFKMVRRGSLLGHDAVELSYEEGDRLRIEVWRIPAAACAVAKMRRYEKKNSNWVLVSAADPIEITLGASDDWLFQVPEDYVEGSPSEVATRTAQRLSTRAGLSPTDPRAVAAVERARKSSERPDEAYRRNRQQHGLSYR